MAGYDATYPAVYPADPAPPVGSANLAIGQEKTTVVRLQTLDGVWEVVGSDRLRGVWPEWPANALSADEWGPSKCSFDLHRDPGAIFPDLSAWTPIEVEVGGVLVWSGRVKETPTREVERVVNVQGKGWQFHLDDDQYQRVYVHERLGDWKDIRAPATAALTVATAAYQVQVGAAAIVIQAPKGTTVAQNTCGGVILDLGPNSQAEAVVVDFEMLNGTANWTMYVRGSDVEDPLGTLGPADYFSLAGTTGSGTGSGIVVAPRRYISIFWYRTGVGGVTANDEGVRITGVRVFADNAYLAGNQSILKATQIIPDALDRATILLSDDRSGIDPDATVTFAFPEFALSGQRTPREVIQAANSVHGYRTMIDVRRRPIFEPRPSVPRIEIGAWPGSVFDDASVNDGEEIYNRVIVEGAGADGAPLTVERFAVQSGGADFVVADPAPTNASFDANATGWTAGGGGSIARTTVAGEFDSAPGAGKWDVGATSGLHTLTATFSGTFRAGATYALTVASQANAAGAGFSLFHDFGVAGVDETTNVFDAPPGTGGFFNTNTIYWSPRENRTGVTLRLRWPHNEFGDLPTAILYVDSLQLRGNHATLVDRRGFRRTHALPVRSSLTAALGRQIGDVWLAAHKTTPLKGAVNVAGDRAAREIKTGASVPPERLLLMTGELLRLSHRVDPDTGGHGRDGRIAQVDYSPATDEASIALDSRRTSHEALLERLAVVVGSG
jgi:hypothetical protein